MLNHRCFGTDLQLAFVIRRSGVSLQDKVSPGMPEDANDKVFFFEDAHTIIMKICILVCGKL